MDPSPQFLFFRYRFFLLAIDCFREMQESETYRDTNYFHSSQAHNRCDRSFPYDMHHLDGLLLHSNALEKDFIIRFGIIFFA